MVRGIVLPPGTRDEEAWKKARENPGNVVRVEPAAVEPAIDQSAAGKEDDFGLNGFVHGEQHAQSALTAKERDDRYVFEQAKAATESFVRMYYPGADLAVAIEEAAQEIAKADGPLEVLRAGVWIVPGLLLSSARKADKVDDNLDASKGVARFHKHHTVPREILKQLPDDVANNPLVRGRAGAPNRWPIPEDVQKAIHKGKGGGAYNDAFKRELETLRRDPTVEDVLRIRDDLVKRFGLEGYRP
jgi:hypothetical protein